MLNLCNLPECIFLYANPLPSSIMTSYKYPDLDEGFRVQDTKKDRLYKQYRCSRHYSKTQRLKETDKKVICLAKFNITEGQDGTALIKGCIRIVLFKEFLGRRQLQDFFHMYFSDCSGQSHLLILKNPSHRVEPKKSCFIQWGKSCPGGCALAA